MSDLEKVANAITLLAESIDRHAKAVTEFALQVRPDPARLSPVEVATALAEEASREKVLRMFGSQMWE